MFCSWFGWQTGDILNFYRRSSPIKRSLSGYFPGLKIYTKISPTPFPILLMLRQIISRVSINLRSKSHSGVIERPISNATIYRIMRKIEEASLKWQSPRKFWQRTHSHFELDVRNNLPASKMSIKMNKLLKKVDRTVNCLAKSSSSLVRSLIALASSP
jgi:hypothetical protein